MGLTFEQLLTIISILATLIGIVVTIWGIYKPTSFSDTKRPDQVSIAGFIITKQVTVYGTEPQYTRSDWVVIITWLLIGFLIQPYFYFVIFLLFLSTGLYLFRTWRKKAVYFQSTNMHAFVLFLLSPIFLLLIYYFGVWLINAAPLSGPFSNWVYMLSNVFLHSFNFAAMIWLILEQVSSEVIPFLRNEKIAHVAVTLLRHWWSPLLIDTIGFLFLLLSIVMFKEKQ